jgi:hypothetical protein
MLFTSAAIDVADHNKGMEKIMLAINHLLIITFIFLPPPESEILLSVFVCLSPFCRSDAKREQKLKKQEYQIFEVI